MVDKVLVASGNQMRRVIDNTFLATLTKMDAKTLKRQDHSWLGDDMVIELWDIEVFQR